jgi:predicted DNA-binding protein with PD1-like motif
MIYGTLKPGADMFVEITKLAREKNITAGTFQAIGTLRRAALGYYDFAERKYIYTTIDKNLELISAIGNFSIKDGLPFPHIHISVSDENGNMFGGHLGEGSIANVCEFYISPVEDESLVRKYDEATGLSLYEKNP